MDNLEVEINSPFNPLPLYKGKPLPNYGEAELFIGDFISTNIMSGMCIFLLNFFRPKYERDYIKELVFIAPPEQSCSYSFSSVFYDLVVAYEKLIGEPPSSEIKEHLSATLKVYHAESMEISSVVQLAKDVKQNAAIFIPFCSKYQSANSDNLNSGKRLYSGSYESIWVDNVVKLSNELLTKANDNLNLFVLVGEELPPVQVENAEKIIAVEGLYPVWMNSESEPSKVEYFQPQIMKWSADCLQGKIKSVLSELEQSSLNESVKEQIKIQLLYKAGEIELACEDIENQLDSGIKFQAEASIMYSRIALDAGNYQLAARLIDGVIEKLFIQKDLELCLTVSTEIGRFDYAQKAYERLESLFKDSIVLKENKLLRILNVLSRMQGFDTKQKLFGLSEFELELVIDDNIHEGTDYPVELDLDLINIINSFKESYAGNYDKSIAYALEITSDSIFEEHVIYQIIFCLNHLLLNGARIDANEGFYESSLLTVINFLARNPDNTRVRDRLFKLISVEGFGKNGLPMLALITLKLSGRGLKIKTSSDDDIDDISSEEALIYFKKVLVWMERQQVIEIGVSRLPKDLVPNNVDSYLIALRKWLNFGTKDGYGDDFVLDKLAYIICLLSPHSNRLIAEDLFALKLLANFFWSQGKPQKARDLAEQILELGINHETRKMLAWGCYSDIYLRQAKPMDALIASCCSFISDIEVEPEHAFEIIFLLAKITRDLYLYDLFEEVITSGYKLVEQYEISPAAEVRLKTLSASVKLIKIELWDSEEATNLVEYLTEICKQVLDIGEEVTPSAILLFQAVENVVSCGVEINDDTTHILASINNLIPQDTQDKLTIFSKNKPQPDDVFKLCDGLEIGVYSEDRPEDLKMVKHLVRKTLNSDSGKVNQEQLFNLLELIADSSTFSTAPQSTIDRDELLSYARSLSKQGFSILMLGLSLNGELRHLLIRDGQEVTLEHGNSTLDFNKVLSSWQDDYPHKYGYIRDNEGNFEFYETMSAFEIPIPDESRLIVCAEPKLQQLPLNILLKDGDFIGNTIPNCYVPSINWLKHIQELPTVKRSKRSAWISTSQDSLGTLEIAHARLESIFVDYNFEVSTDSKLPLNCSNSEVTVITAHGVLSEENGYFNKIADEQDCYFTPRMLASNISHCDLIILFVCSGGRLDKSPYSEASYGLPKMLLENSCKTVIASPWPLDSFIIDTWLDSFLAEWNKGKYAIDSCFEANRAVLEKYSHFAGQGLAMSLYGDPTIVSK